MVAMNDQGEVRAAGGLVCRPAGDGRGVEVLLVHRPRYDDWTLPKGKADEGEDDEACALREVAEETGFLCRLGPELPTVRYADRFGRPKAVRFWRMEVVGGKFQPNQEVDAVAWLSPADALTRLSYRRDAEVISSLGRGAGTP